jgi:predicted transcriptional regulator
MTKSDLPKPAKVATTHALRDLGFQIRHIADTLGIGERSVSRYLTETPEEQWQEFGNNVKKLMRVKEDEVASQALKLIEEKLPRAQFRDLVGLYKILRELRDGGSSSSVELKEGDRSITFQVTRGE